MFTLLLSFVTAALCSPSIDQHSKHNSKRNEANLSWLFLGDWLGKQPQRKMALEDKTLAIYGWWFTEPHYLLSRRFGHNIYYFLLWLCLLLPFLFGILLRFICIWMWARKILSKGFAA